MGSTKRIWTKALIFGLAMVFFACSGGGSGGDDGSSVQTGSFLDSAVAGITYTTPTQSGITSTFKYLNGESVQFSMGSVILGEAQGKEWLSPVDLVPGAIDETNPAVTNIARFLQSLDWDGDVGDGITITTAMRDEAQGRSINFAQSITDFENDPDVQSFFDTLNQLGLFGTGGTRSIVSSAQAQNHLKTTIALAGFAGDYSGTFGNGGRWRFHLDREGQVRLGSVSDSSGTLVATIFGGQVDSSGNLGLGLLNYGPYDNFCGMGMVGTIDSAGNVQGTCNFSNIGFSGIRTE